MSERNSSRSHLGAALAMFCLCATTAFALLLVAFVHWLTVYIGSFLYALLIAGGGFLVLALMIYCFGLHRALRQFRSRMDTIYEVARLAMGGYEWFIRRVGRLFGWRL